MWKYQNAKDYNPNWSVITDLNYEKIVKILYEKELQQMSQTQFKIEKVRRRIGDKVSIKWNGYDNLFNCWINKRDIL